jgi:hypothetical protein
MCRRIAAPQPAKPAVPFRLTWEPNGVYREYFGAVTIAERQASFDAICNDARFDSLRYTITDYLAATSYEVDLLATAEIAALHVGPLITNPRIAIAAVATQADVLAAIGDFIGLGFIDAPYRVFPDLAQARQWIQGHFAPAPSAGTPPPG